MCNSNDLRRFHNHDVPKVMIVMNVMCYLFSQSFSRLIYFKGNERFKLFNSFWGRDDRIFNISRENKPFEINAA